MIDSAKKLGEISLAIFESAFANKIGEKITFQAKMCYSLGVESKNTHAEMLSLY